MTRVSSTPPGLLTSSLGCTRGHVNVEQSHAIGDSVFGPFYVEGTLIEDGVEYTSRSWPTGLVKRVDVEDGGLLNLATDEVTIGEQGRVDPRDPIMASIRENTTSELVSQANSEPNMAFVSDRTRGPGAVSLTNVTSSLSLLTSLSTPLVLSVPMTPLVLTWLLPRTFTSFPVVVPNKRTPLLRIRELVPSVLLSTVYLSTVTFPTRRLLVVRLLDTLSPMVVTPTSILL